MRSAFICFLIFFTGISAFAQQFNISGKIVDDAGKPVPFASVYIQNTTKGASANSDGEYSIGLTPGKYTVQYKAVGYKQESRVVDLSQNRTVNVTLSTEVYQLQTVSVGGADPAIAIMRKAIKKRKTYLNEVKAYTADIYIKGMQKLLDAPKKFLGRDMNELGKQLGLDSNRRGIVYLSESQSKYSYMYPNKVHEEMVSSKVSGSNRAFSFNRATDMRVNFYENFENWGRLSLRPLISPIADNGFFYYNYRWIGETVENGKTVNKIKVTPRREHDPCFEGYIYIQDDSWRLVGLNLFITKKANLALVDTIKINQQFVPVSDKAWMTSNLRFDFVGGLFGFRLGGYFISIYKNYDLAPTFNKKEFNEVLRITKEVNKKDSTYWQQERPIPLTAEERTDYKKKEVLAAKRESKTYLDSVDKVNNKFHPVSLLIGGINNINRYKKEYWHVEPLPQQVRFNTVEGFSLNLKGTFTKQIDSLNNRYFRLGVDLGYGFSNHLFNGVVTTVIPVDKFALGINIGSDVVDLNNHEPITPLANTLHSLFAHQNLEKFYQKQFVSASLSGRIVGGWQATAIAEFAGRTSLSNTSNFSFFKKDRVYTSNNPMAPDADVPLFPKNQSFKLGLRTTYDFSNKYETYPNGRRYLPSPYPTIGLSYTKGVKNIFGSDVDYDKISADISKSDIPMGVYGRTSFYIGAGKYINANNLYFPDHAQFNGNQSVFYRSGPASFLLLDFYTYSTRTEYIEGHFEHNFSGFITNKIPIIRKLRLQEIVHLNYLTSPELKNYYELGLGLQYLNIKVLYGQSYNSGSNVRSALRVGIGF